MRSLGVLKCLLGSALVLSTLAGAAHAAVVNYSESVSGDINRRSFALDVGVNTISGTSGRGTFDDYDDFLFFVPFSSVLVGLTVTVNGTTGDHQLLGWDLFTDGYGLGTNLGRVGAPPEFSSAFAGVPLAAGDYYMFQYEFFRGVGAGSNDYTITLNVRELPQALPEPSSYALAGLALCAAALMRRRRS
jgi:MYXO-CTERM domain-containing protein